MINLFDWLDPVIEYFGRYNINIDEINIAARPPSQHINHNYSEISVEFVIDSTGIDTKELHDIIHDSPLLYDLELEVVSADVESYMPGVITPMSKATIRCYQKEPTWIWVEE
jgi:hypothetical protein